jgi:flagellin-like hook-associated protein FlgL
MASINTNYGAAIALQNLNKTSSELERTQNRINTGMKVSSAKDSGAIFSIATSQRAAAASQDAVRSSIQRGQSIVDVALAAGDTITSALEEQKGLAVSIAGSTGAAQTFVGKLQDSLDAGVGNLVDADLAKESAKLQSLQTKQQLGIQALSIANSSSRRS